MNTIFLLEENFRKDVSVMCNLSQGIEEKGIAIGEARKEEKIILNMHNNGFTVEQIAMATDKKRRRSENDYCRKRTRTCIKLCKKKRAFEFKQLGGSCYIKIWEIIDTVKLSDEKWV